MSREIAMGRLGSERAHGLLASSCSECCWHSPVQRDYGTARDVPSNTTRLPLPIFWGEHLGGKDMSEEGLGLMHAVWPVRTPFSKHFYRPNPPVMHNRTQGAY